MRLNARDFILYLLTGYLYTCLWGFERLLLSEMCCWTGWSCLGQIQCGNFGLPVTVLSDGVISVWKGRNLNTLGCHSQGFVMLKKTGEMSSNLNVVNCTMKSVPEWWLFISWKSNYSIFSQSPAKFLYPSSSVLNHYPFGLNETYRKHNLFHLFRG